MLRLDHLLYFGHRLVKELIFHLLFSRFGRVFKFLGWAWWRRKVAANCWYSCASERFRRRV